MSNFTHESIMFFINSIATLIMIVLMIVLNKKQISNKSMWNKYIIFTITIFILNLTLVFVRLSDMFNVLYGFISSALFLAPLIYVCSKKTNLPVGIVVFAFAFSRQVIWFQAILGKYSKVEVFQYNGISLLVDIASLLFLTLFLPVCMYLETKKSNLEDSDPFNA